MQNLNKIYATVNGKRISIAAMLATDKWTIITVNMDGCTDLTSGKWIYFGSDSRCYGFMRHLQAGDYRVRAGCRNFSIAEARAHWGAGGESNRPDCFAIVEAIAASITEMESV